MIAIPTQRIGGMFSPNVHMESRGTREYESARIGYAKLKSSFERTINQMTNPKIYKATARRNVGFQISC